MVDKVKPLKIDDDNESIPIPTEFTSTDDYVSVKGVSFEDSDSHLIDRDNVTDELQWKDSVQTTYRKFNTVGAQADAARFTLSLLHTSTISDGTFYGYSATIPGDTTPVILPINSEFIEFTWSNSQSTADYTLDFMKNSTVATPFLSVTKVDTQFFTQELVTPESFSAGDTIYVKHTKGANNSADVAIVLYFQAVL